MPRRGFLMLASGATQLGGRNGGLWGWLTSPDSGDARTFNVRDYGAKGDGVTDDSAAFAAAIAAIPQSGGTVEVPPGIYAVSSTIDLTAVPTGVTVRMVGAGPRLSWIKTSVTTTAGINAASGNNRFVGLRGLSLYQASGATPTARRGGNYGIRNTGAVAYELHIEDVEVRYFGDAALHLEGPTAPIRVANCSLQSCAGYGVETGLVDGHAVEDLSVIGGDIQNCWGGIHAYETYGMLALKVDIELGADARFPALFLDHPSYGNTFVACSFAVGAPAVTPNAVVASRGGGGAVILGGINNAVGGMDNVLLDEGSADVTIIGGEYFNHTTGGYFVSDTGANTCAIICPFVIASTYAAGKNIVNDVVGQNNFIVGVGAAHGVTFNDGVFSRVPSGVVNLDYGAVVAWNAAKGDHFRLVATDAAACTIKNPDAGTALAGQRVTFDIVNGTARSMGPVSFDSNFRLAGAFNSPAGGRRRTIQFYHDGSSFVEVGRAAADI